MSDLPKTTKNEYHIGQTKKVIEILKKQKLFKDEEMLEHMKIHKMGCKKNDNK